MTFKVIEINDIGIKVSNEQELMLTSPGYAHIEKKEIEFGSGAKHRAKLDPTSSFNQFWQSLNLEPLPHPVAHYRHFADIAYSHLKSLAEEANIDGDIVLAVPGSYGNQELGILLGLIKQCPFNVIGIVDIAVIAAAKSMSLDRQFISIYNCIKSCLQN